MITLYVGDIYTKVNGQDWKAQSAVYQALSFKEQSYSPYRGRIETVDSLYDSQNCRFLTGLLRRVTSRLDQDFIPYEIVDKRPVLTEKTGSPDLHGITLRDYQLKTVKSLIRKKRGVAQLATGAGKTEVSAAVTKALNVPTIFLTHRVNLMRQSHARYQERIPELAGKMGMIGDKIYKPGDQVTFAMVQTIQAMLRNKSKKKREQIVSELARYKCMFIDEAHRVGDNYFNVAATLCNNAHYRFGLTATPFMGDSARDDLMLEGVTGEVAAKVTASKLIELGYLARPLCKFIYIDQSSSPMDKIKAWRDIYERGIIHNDYRNQVICEQAETLVRLGKKTLIIVVEKEHGKNLQEILKNKKVKAKYVDGSTKTSGREAALASLSKGKTDCIICTNIFDEGIDTGCIGAVILAGGTKSAPALFQRAGRAMRRKEENNFCVIVDFIDQTHPKLKEHSLRRYKLVQREEGFKII